MVADPDNRIADAGAQALADGLKEIKGLEKLYLYGECVIGVGHHPHTVANHTRTPPSPPVSGGSGWVRGGWT